MKNINIIVAKDVNNGIGYENNLLTHLPNDLKRFKSLTENNIVIMGYNTFTSLKREKGLPNRVNIVLTFKELENQENLIFTNDLNEVLNKYENDKREIFFIGGNSIYKLASQLKNREKTYFITEIENKFEKVDTFFPIIIDETYLIYEEEFFKDDKHKYNYIFKKYIVK